MILTQVQILTGSSEGSGRNSASSPKIKSGGNSGCRALNIISPGKKRRKSHYLIDDTNVDNMDDIPRGQPNFHLIRAAKISR